MVITVTMMTAREPAIDVKMKTMARRRFNPEIDTDSMGVRVLR